MSWGDLLVCRTADGRSHGIEIHVHAVDRATSAVAWYELPMDHGTLPDGAVLQRTTDVFDAASVPSGLLRAHRIAVDVWGVIHVVAGTVTFVCEEEGAATVSLGAGDTVVIPPGVRHHVEPGPDARFRIAFHR